MNKLNSKTVIKKVDDKEKSAEKKTPSIQDIKKVLDQEIVKFQHKSELIANRERFMLTKNELNDYMSDQGIDYNDTLDSSNLKVVLSDQRKLQRRSSNLNCQ
jgi:hypothetical protein